MLFYRTANNELTERSWKLEYLLQQSVLTTRQSTYKAVDDAHCSGSVIWLYKVLHLHPQTTVVALTFSNVLNRVTMSFLRWTQIQFHFTSRQHFNDLQQ